MPNIVERARAAREDKKKSEAEWSMRPKTLVEPDRTTFYCSVRNKRFEIFGCKILEHYANGDCRVYAPNGVQFTAKAEEVFHIHKGDYHETVSL